MRLTSFRVFDQTGLSVTKFKILNIYRRNSECTIHEHRPLGYKTSCSTQLRIKFILLINVKMPTIVGILTFMRRINQ